MSGSNGDSKSHESQFLSGDLLNIFDLVHSNENWIIPLKNALEGVTAEDAIWKPVKDVASIWEITNHVLTWTRDVTKMLSQQERTEPEDWPAVGEADAAAWAQMLAGVDEAMQAFREQVARLSPEELMMRGPNGGSRFTGIMSIITHNAYHAGQIAKLRALREAIR